MSRTELVGEMPQTCQIDGHGDGGTDSGYSQREDRWYHGGKIAEYGAGKYNSAVDEK